LWAKKEVARRVMVPNAGFAQVTTLGLEGRTIGEPDDSEKAAWFHWGKGRGAAAGPKLVKG